MWDISIRLKNLFGLLGIFGVIWGCAGTPTGYHSVLEQGLQTAAPKSGTKVVVGGNLPEAVDEALRWLNDHQLLVVNRWVDSDVAISEDPPRMRRASVDQKLAGAYKMGASLVILVQVEKQGMSHMEAPMITADRTHKMGVNVQGINAETGKIIFAAQAWNEEARPASQRLVRDLTILALETIWQGSQSAPFQQKESVPQTTTGGKAPNHAPVPVNPPHPMTSKPNFPELQNRSAPQEASSKESNPEEPSPAPVVTQPLPSEQSRHSQKPSLGIQLAGWGLSVLYTPLKVVYAGLGGIMGGLAYGLTAGNEEVAQSLWDTSLHGTWWLTPDHLQGHEPIRFKGEPAN